MSNSQISYQETPEARPSAILFKIQKIFKIRSIFQLISALLILLLGILSVIRVLTWNDYTIHHYWNGYNYDYYYSYNPFINFYEGTWYGVFFVILTGIIGISGMVILVYKILTLVQMKNFREASKVEMVDQMYKLFLIGFILEVVGLVFISYILNIIAYTKFSQWFESLNAHSPSIGMNEALKGSNIIKIGEILRILPGIGILIQAIGFMIISKGILREYHETEYKWLDLWCGNRNSRQIESPIGLNSQMQPINQSQGGNTSYFTAPKPKDRTTAGILAILLGGLGVHQFYLEKIEIGILMLCFGWTGIPGIIGLIQGIIYLSKSDQEFQSYYVKPSQNGVLTIPPPRSSTIPHFSQYNQETYKQSSNGNILGSAEKIATFYCSECGHKITLFVEHTPTKDSPSPY